MKLTLQVTLFVFLCSNLCGQGLWTPKASVPPVTRKAAFAESVNGMGYIGMGHSGSGYRNDLWMFDPAANSWTAKASFPGAPREDVVHFALNGKIYVGLGTDNTTFFLDFWEYDPILDSWAQRDSFPAMARCRGASFSLNGKGYIACGQLSNYQYTTQVWEYDPALDQWIQQNNFPGGARYYPTGLSTNSTGYMMMGINTSGFIYENWAYDAANDTWQQKINAPAGGAGACGAVCTNGKAYIDIGATNSINFWAYDLAGDAWTLVSDNGIVRADGCSFSIGDSIYLGCGLNASYYLNDFHRYYPCTNTTVTVQYANDTVAALPANYVSYVWRYQLWDTVSTATAFSPVVSGNYFLFATDSIGCVATDTFYVNMPTSDLTFVNVFYDPNEGCIVPGDIEPTADGGMITAGHMNSDLILAKFDGAGQVQWSKRIDHNVYLDRVFSVKEAPDGGFLLAGNSYNGSSSISYTFISKTDAQGTQLWSMTVGDFSVCRKALPLADGGFVMIGDEGLSGATCVTRFDSALNVVWQRKFSIVSPNFDAPPMDLIATADGGFAVCGYGNRVVSSGADLMFAFKLNSAGNMLWSKTYMVDIYTRAYSLAEYPGGDIAVTGEILSEVYLMRLNGTNGSLVWMKQNLWYGFPSQIVRCQYGGFLLSGQVIGINWNNLRGFMLRVSDDGETFWTNSPNIGVAMTASWDYPFRTTVKASETVDGSVIFFNFADNYNFFFPNAVSYIMRGHDDGDFGCSQSLGFSPRGTDTIIAPLSTGMFQQNFAGTYVVTTATYTNYNFPSMLTDCSSCVPPLANFTMVANDLTVDFQDSASNGVSYHWDFGDGDTSIYVNPQHTYAASGTYQVCLIVTSPCGSDTICQSITVISTVGINEATARPAISIYPNPVSGGGFSFNGELPESFLVELVDVRGSVVQRDQVQRSNPVVECASLVPGVYFLRVIPKNEMGEVKVLRVVKVE